MGLIMVFVANALITVVAFMILKKDLEEDYMFLTKHLSKQKIHIADLFADVSDLKKGEDPDTFERFRAYLIEKGYSKETATTYKNYVKRLKRTNKAPTNSAGKNAVKRFVEFLSKDNKELK